MLRDARAIASGSTLRREICIVGAGAAGITIARALAERGITSCVLEAGGAGFSRASQAFYEGAASGTLLGKDTGYAVSSRLRFLGGSTNHWGGWCRPLNDLDFERRPWIEGSGWPIRASDLEPYEQAARTILGIRPFTYDEATLASFQSKPLGFGENADVTTDVYHQSTVNFGRTFRAELERAEAIDLILNSTVFDVSLESNGINVKRVEVRTLDARTFFVEARLYVLAAGGLENPRLLLLSDRVRGRGIGNEHDNVGRYFMDHLHVPIGRIALWYSPKDAALYTDFHDEPSVGAAVLGALRVTAGQQEQHRLQNAAFTICPTPAPLARSPGGHADFVRSYVSHFYSTRRPPSPGSPDYDAAYQRYLSDTLLFESAASVANEMDRLTETAADGGTGATTAGVLFARAEQAPNRESRVTLDGDAVDPFGQRRLKLDWQVGEGDKTSLLETARIIGRQLGVAALGRLQILLDERSPITVGGAGYHHMGTTRMHDDPRLGVVDADCRVHDVANLFVAGSSVFPTSGYANPTFTLVALAARLAAHLAGELRHG